MPTSPRSRGVPPSTGPSSVHNTTTSDRSPNALRSYTFHGVSLDMRGGHGVGDCPFCGKEGKFSVDVVTGLWRCFVCGAGTTSGGGNALTFIRLLHERSLSRTLGIGDAHAGRNGEVGPPPGVNGHRPAPHVLGDFWRVVASDRRLLSAETVRAWGVVASIVDSSWLVPGYGTDGKLDQLYRFSKFGNERRLLPTPGLWPEGKVHALHLPAGDFDPSRPSISIHEGPWDGMAMWEVVHPRPDCNVIAVPGCNVWRDEWTEMCRGKHVCLWFDSDHPIKEALNQGKTIRPGLDGMCRVAKRLSGVAASVKFVRWGKEGYDESKPSGWDVRDHLAQGNDLSSRKRMLDDLVSKVEDVPKDWFLPNQVMVHASGSGNHDSIESAPCNTWAACEEKWIKAMEWRRDLSDMLAVVLATCASTKQGGNQLFVDFVGSPGVAKTTVLRGALVSKHCVHVENVTKIMSGYKKPGDEGADCSFLARANNKTWVTCEFDTVLSSPQYAELMGKMRRIFDGETSSVYGNSDEDRIYRALRTPWLRAGTWIMMYQDQSQMGDRFIRFILNDPDEKDKRKIVRSAIRAEKAAIMETSNGTTGSILDPRTRDAYSVTGGYVDWLRANIEEKLSHVTMSEEAEDRCIDLADLSADLRARPTTSGGKRRGVNSEDNYASKELPTRLARQNVRLAYCLAVVQNKTEVDAEVLRIVSKVALDTAHGHSQNIAKWLCSPDPRAPGRTYQESGGFMEGVLSQWTGMQHERLMAYLTFLKQIGVLRVIRVESRPTSWVLTDRVYELYLKVMGVK